MNVKFSVVREDTDEVCGDCCARQKRVDALKGIGFNGLMMIYCGMRLGKDSGMRSKFHRVRRVQQQTESCDVPRRYLTRRSTRNFLRALFLCWVTQKNFTPKILVNCAL